MDPLDIEKNKVSRVFRENIKYTKTGNVVGPLNKRTLRISEIILYITMTIGT